MATIIENSTKKVETKKNPSKIGIYILSHKLIFTLFFALVVLSIWAFIKITMMENSFEKQTLELTTGYENKIDSLTAKQLILTSKVFAWAIRSELTRDNKEQVNQFFLSFIKESGVNKLRFVDAKTAKMTLSTDKKDEGTVYANQVALMTDEAISFTEDSVLNVISPVMGLNSKLGVLIIEYQRK